MSHRALSALAWADEDQQQWLAIVVSSLPWWNMSWSMNVNGISSLRSQNWEQWAMIPNTCVKMLCRHPMVDVGQSHQLLCPRRRPPCRQCPICHLEFGPSVNGEALWFPSASSWTSAPTSRCMCPAQMKMWDIRSGWWAITAPRGHISSVIWWNIWWPWRMKWRSKTVVPSRCLSLERTFLAAVPLEIDSRLKTIKEC